MARKHGTRILMLLENTSFPGDPRVRREATTLTAAGYQVTVISPRRPGQKRRETIHGVRVYRFRAPSAGDGFWGFVWEYGYSLTAAFWLSLQVFFRHGFDVIHAHNPPDLFVLIAMFYRVGGKKFVFDHHDLSPEMYLARLRDGGNGLVFRVLVFFEKLSCRMAHHVIATNESYRQMEMERSRVPADRITIVRNGPDLQRVKLVEPDAELRQKARFILGFVGLMGYQDGVDYLLRALHHLIHDLNRDDVYAVLVGKGTAVPRLKQLVQELGLEQHVWFPGGVPDAEMLRYLSTADICVDSDPSNPFNDRSTMIKMMEYMALAKPIVAFDLPEHRATAADAALYAQANSELDFARKLALLMDDAELRKRMGQVGRERIETHLAWPYQAQHLLDAYAKLGARPQPVTAADGHPSKPPGADAPSHEIHPHARPESADSNALAAVSSRNGD